MFFLLMALQKQFFFLVLLAVILMGSSAVYGKLLVSISIGTFRVLQKIKCDVFTRCDYKFVICIDHIQSNNRLTDCTYRRIATRTYNYDPIDLSREIGNQIEISMNSWTGGIHLKIQVLDHDHVDSSDVVDTFSVKYRGPLHRSYSVKLSSRTSIPVTFSSSCYEDYYGPTCDTYCRPSYGFLLNQRGYYSCNTSTGAKICASGWTGSLCNIKITTTTTTTTTPSTTTTTTPSTTTTTTPSTTTTVSTPSTMAMKIATNMTSPTTTISSSKNLYTEITHNFTNHSTTTIPSTSALATASNSNDSTNQSELSLTSLHLIKPICGDIYLGSSKHNKEFSEHILSSLLQSIQMALMTVGNCTFKISHYISECEKKYTLKLKLTYCVDAMSDNANVQDLLKNELYHNHSHWDIIQKPECPTHNNVILPAVLTSVIVTIGIASILLLVYCKKRKHRSEEIKNYAFVYTFRKEEKKDDVPITEELISILDE